MISGLGKTVKKWDGGKNPLFTRIYTEPLRPRERGEGFRPFMVEPLKKIVCVFTLYAIYCTNNGIILSKELQCTVWYTFHYFVQLLVLYCKSYIHCTKMYGVHCTEYNFTMLYTLQLHTY